jgi:hypothetical protein
MERKKQLGYLVRLLTLGGWDQTYDIWHQLKMNIQLPRSFDRFRSYVSLGMKIPTLVKHWLNISPEYQGFDIFRSMTPYDFSVSYRIEMRLDMLEHHQSAKQV